MKAKIDLGGRSAWEGPFPSGNGGCGAALEGMRQLSESDLRMLLDLIDRLQK